MRKINIDIDFLTKELHTVNSAAQMSEISQKIEQNQRLLKQNREQISKRNATLLAGAEATIEQKELFEQQIEILQKQNDLLFENYSKLKELFDAQVEANKEAKEDLKQSKRYNIVMMIVSIIAMFAAIAGPIVTILVS